LSFEWLLIFFNKLSITISGAQLFHKVMRVFVAIGKWQQIFDGVVWDLC